MELQHSIEIAAPPEAVFNVLADADAFQRIDPGLVEYSPPGPMILGREGTFVHRRNGFTARTTWRVLELDAPRRIRVEIHGRGYGIEETADLAASPTGTRAAFLVRVWPTSLPGRLFVALSGGILRRDLEGRADRLRGLLEGRPQK